MCYNSFERGCTVIKTICDFDNTIVRTAKRVIEILNERYGLSKTEHDLYDYGFKSIHEVSTHELEEILGSKELFNKLEFYEDALDTLQGIKDLVVCTSGNTEQIITRRYNFVKQYIPNAKFIAVRHSSDKKIFDMSGCIFVDDIRDTVVSTNASHKIVFSGGFHREQSKIKPNDEVYLVSSWKEIKEIIDFVGENDVY